MYIFYDRSERTKQSLQTGINTAMSITKRFRTKLRTHGASKTFTSIKLCLGFPLATWVSSFFLRFCASSFLAVLPEWHFRQRPFKSAHISFLPPTRIDTTSRLSWRQAQHESRPFGSALSGGYLHLCSMIPGDNDCPTARRSKQGSTPVTHTYERSVSSFGMSFDITELNGAKKNFTHHASQ